DLDAAAADALERLVLHGADDLALRLQRHVRYLVEEQSAAMRLLESADFARRVRALGAGLAAEQLELEPLWTERRAIERDERPRRAARLAVQHARHHVLAGAGRTTHQHATAGAGDALDLLAELAHGMRDADQLLVTAGAQPQLLDLAPQPRRLDGALDHQQQAVGFERLLDEVVGADLDGGDGGLDRAVAADHDDGQIGQLAADDLENLDAIQLAALQPD